MKRLGFRRYLLCVIAVAAVAHLTVTNPAFATTTQVRNDGPQAQVEYSADELETVRAKLLDVVDAVKEMAGLLQDNTKRLERMEELRSQVEQLSAKELTTFRRAIDPSKFDSAGLIQARQTLADRKGSESFLASKRRGGQSSDFTPLSAGFPSVPFSAVFGNSRLSDDDLFAVDAVYLAAESLAVSIKDACLQTVVVLGEGGNTSTACIISDGVFFVAKAVWVTIHMTEDHITAANVDTSYARLDHIHRDLENSVANDNTNAASIKSNDDFNTANIRANTDSKAASIISNANSNTTTITNNADTNTSSILTAISGAATSITSGSSSGQTQVRDLIVDTQIEADLARDTASTPVARYLIPSSAGGLLDRVRSVVVQTITIIQAAGGTTGTAQSFVTQGDQYKAAGQFKQAYDSYRRAYQMAARF